jgi:hypothetical protein
MTGYEPMNCSFTIRISCGSSVLKPSVLTAVVSILTGVQGKARDDRVAGKGCKEKAKKNP